ncbi:MAG: cytochrome c [Terracidiphilus sp.]|nr:cytochrome c [Terracidiphilus sp.]
MARILLGVILGILIFPAALLVWFSRGKVPVAVADPPLPYEGALTHIPLEKRIDKELIHTPAVAATEANYVAGAHVYAENCAVCHGFHGKPAPLGQRMFPVAPQLWEKHRNSPIVGVSDDPIGETYWKVANGIRLTGMPEFRSLLSDTEMWQVSVLLGNADKPLPPAALTILRDEPASKPAKAASDAAAK